ncbi:MAG: DNA polymerase III subunit beta [Mycoplasmataceae bacterium]|jgi:DNA polymerase-3 subunit beta|nr:DNA polymerase III subunit beta [Mycoplasmataceae bacterium]
MKIEIQKDELLKNIKIVNSVIDDNSLNPTLTGIKFICKDNSLIIIGSNNNVSVQTTTNNLTIHKPGEILIKSKIIFNIISKLKNEKVLIEKIDNSILHISASDFSSDINLLDENTYPNINFNISTLTKITIPFNFFKETALKISNTIDPINDYSKPINGILFDATRLSNTLECIGSDGKFLSYLKTEFPNKFKININISIIKYINEALDKSTDINFYINNKELLIQIYNIIFNCRTPEGDYPSAIKHIEKTYKHSIQINRDQLYLAIDRAAVITSADKNPSITFKLTNNTLKISSRSVEYGSSFEQIPITGYTGEDISASFNIRRLLILIKNISNKQINIQFDSETSPFLFKDPKEPNYISLLTVTRTF